MTSELISYGIEQRSFW